MGPSRGGCFLSNPPGQSASGLPARASHGLFCQGDEIRFLRVANYILSHASPGVTVEGVTIAYA